VNRRQFLGLVAAAVLVLAGALYLSSRRNAQPDLHGAALLPSLPGELATVSAVSLRRGKATPTVTLHSQGGHWTVAERGDYPADVTKLRKLLLALGDAKIVEEKTSNPASFPAIGVEDPKLPGATGAEVSVTAQDGTHAVIVGKPVGEGNFVRRGGENTSYSVEPGISFETEPRFWIDSHLPEIAAATIQSIAVKPADGPGYTIHKEAGAKSAAALKDAVGGGKDAAAGGKDGGAKSATAPKDAVAGGTDAAAGSNSAAAGGNAAAAGGNAAAAGGKDTAAGGTDAGAGTKDAAAPEVFTLDGVPAGRKAAESEVLAPSPTTFGGLTADDVAPASEIDFSKASVATLNQADGNVITVTGAAVGDKHWIKLQASKDTAFNAKTAGHAFEIASYRFDAIFRPLEQLLVPKPPPAAKPAKPAKPAAPAAKPGATGVTPKPVPAPTS